MRALLQNPLWHKALKELRYQKWFGRISAICLVVALSGLADGLIAQMRAGVNELEMLPEQRLAISGPAALKNPLASDLIVRFLPEGAPVTFEFEGFYTGYWFGSGMWRGQLRVDSEAKAGTYELRISFKGAGSQNTQKYIIHVFATPQAMQSAALSFLKRHLGVNPFILAAFSGAAGLVLGLITYIYGRILLSHLHTLGLVPIYSGSADDIVCLSPGSLVPKTGSIRMVMDETGHVLCEARTISYDKGKLKLVLLDRKSIPAGFVCLRHPESTI